MSTNPNVARPLAGTIHFEDPTFDSQLLRTLAHGRMGGSDLGEALATAFRIEPGNFESWYREWNATAVLVSGRGEESLQGMHAVSAGEAFLRATEYHRQSVFFLRDRLEDPRILQALDDSRACFRRALELLKVEFEPLEIPYENTSLPGYWFPCPGGDGRTLLMMGGYDATVEELYFFGVGDALRRGYHVLAWDGPGQGHALVRHQLHFRADYEEAVRPVMDYVLGLEGVDAARVALRAPSFGGYLGPRAASAEPRLAALAVDTALYDLGATARVRFPASLVQLWEDRNWDQLDQVMEAAMAEDPAQRFFFASRMATHGVTRVSQYLQELDRFSLRGRAASIRCPVAVGTQPGNSEEARLLYEELTVPRSLIAFTAEEGGADHGAEGAPALVTQRFFDWMDRVLEGGGHPPSGSR